MHHLRWAHSTTETMRFPRDSANDKNKNTEARFMRGNLVSERGMLGCIGTKVAFLLENAHKSVNAASL